MTLGGLEIEYCQPLTRTTRLAEQLGKLGAGVVSVVFGSLDPGAVLDRAAQFPAISFSEDIDEIGLATLSARNEARYLISSEALIGFDISLEKIEEGQLNGDCLCWN